MPAYIPQHVGNLGRGLKLFIIVFDFIDLTQHVGNLGRGLKHKWVSSNEKLLSSARWKPRKGIETHYLGRKTGFEPLSTLETSEGD